MRGLSIKQEIVVIAYIEGLLAEQTKQCQLMACHVTTQIDRMLGPILCCSSITIIETVALQQSLRARPLLQQCVVIPSARLVNSKTLLSCTGRDGNADGIAHQSTNSSS